MVNYQVHPDTYGIEIRDGQSVEDYISVARRFRSTAEFREFRDAGPERRKEMRRSRDNNSAEDGDDDRRRTLEFLKASK